METLTALSIYTVALIILFNWFKSYFNEKMKDVERNKERIASLEITVQHKEEKLVLIADKLEVLVDSINKTNLNMVELQTLMQVYLEKKK